MDHIGHLTLDVGIQKHFGCRGQNFWLAEPGVVKPTPTLARNRLVHLGPEV